MNYNNITDTHAHYHDNAFAHDMHRVLTSLPQNGIVRIVNCGTDVSTSRIAADLSNQYPYLYFASGIHGLDVCNAKSEDLQEIEHIALSSKCVAIGEIGLDYHYEAQSKALQLYYFEEQIKLAEKMNLPIIVHDREAHSDTLELLQKYKPTGVVHCFSGSVELAKEILSLGMYIGIGGAVTFHNAKKPVEVAKYVPIDKLLLETDCPYMSPVPHRGERNISTNIPITAEFIAELRNMDTQDLIDATSENAKRLFGF